MARMTRRGVIGGAAALATAGVARTLPAPPPMGVGIQLYSVKDRMAEDVEGTLRALGRMGYQSVETAGLHERGPEAFAQMLDAAGLSCTAAHAPLPLTAAECDAAVAEARDLGARWVVVPSPRRPRELGLDSPEDAMTVEAWRRNAALLQELGQRATAAGLGVGYHNHAGEFEGRAGETGFELLLAGTDPAVVKLELDVAWAVVGGHDPAALIRRHADRVRLLHLKDLATRPEPGVPVRTVELGRGVVDFPAILAAADAAGVDCGFVELEPPYPRPELAMAAESLRALERLGR